MAQTALIYGGASGTRPQSATGDGQIQNTLGMRKLSSERSAAAAFMRHPGDGGWAFEGTPGGLPYNHNLSNSQQHLTTHVWPKSRMLFAIVSKMSKEGVVTER